MLEDCLRLYNTITSSPGLGFAFYFREQTPSEYRYHVEKLLHVKSLPYAAIKPALLFRDIWKT